jgi:DNA-binding MarR family transcriptional regulator
MVLVFSRRGALPLSRLGARLQVHPTSVTNAVDRLEQQGLIERAPHPTDGRTTLAVITEDSRKIALRATDAVNSSVFADPGLVPEDVEALVAILGRLRRRAGDFG